MRNADLFIDGCLFENNTAIVVSSGNNTSVGRGGVLYVENSDTSCSGRKAIVLTNSVLRNNK